VHPTVVTNRFRKLSGQVYSPEKMDERFRELLRTGLFTNLRINTEALPSNVVHISLTAEEARHKELGFSIGYSTYEGAIFGFRIGDRNLFGSGRPLTLDVDYSQRGLKADVLYVNPWLFETDISFRARLFVLNRDEIGYSKRDEGLRLEFTGKPAKHFEVTGFLETKNVEITSAAIVSSFLGPTSYQIATLGLTQSLDYRDSPVNPSKGWIITAAADFDTIGGSAGFGRATARITDYIPIYKKLLLALGARGGLIYPLSTVPIDERYFNGGATTVRSFTERELGPQDPHNYPIGGEEFSVFNAELQFPLHDDLVGAVFADAGNVVSDFENAGLQNMRYALGVGLRYKLPIGPIRLDVGFNPDPKQNESWGAVNFSFGFAF
jgi:outer membrane protein assembly complex protein YaeT